VTDYRVSQDAFDGPMDLLLYLVKQDEVDIYEISLERITRQYLDYLDRARELDVPLAGEFIVMASNLIYWKSRALLPKHVQPPEDEEDEDDPRWDLIRQLLEYKKFKEVADHLAVSETQRARLYTHRPTPPVRPSAEDAPLEVAPEDLFQAFQKVLLRAAAAETSGEIIDDRWTVSEKLEDLRHRVRPGGRICFSTLFRDGATRGELIVTFLAILELMRIREFHASQNDYLGDIELHRSADS